MSRLGALPAWAAPAAAAAVAVLALTVTWSTAWGAYLHTPYSDPHSWLHALFDAERTGAASCSVWRPFNQQRIPLALAALRLDVGPLHGRAPIFLLLGALAQATAFAAVTWRLASARLAPWRATALAGAAGLLLGGANWAEDLALPVFSVYPVAAGFAAAACALAAGEGGRWRVPAAAALAAFAGGGNAAGLAVWPVLLFWAAAERRSAREQALLWAAAVVTIAALEWGLGAPGGSAGATATHGAARLAKQAQYLFGFAGLWWGALSHEAATRAAGAFVLLAAVAGLRVRPEPSAAGDVQRLGRRLVNIGLLVAVLAALGRVDELPQPVVPTRYAPFAAVLQLGALLCWSGPLTALARPRPRAAAAVVALVTLAAFAMQLKAARVLGATSRQLRAASAAFDRGDRSPTVVQLVDAQPEMDAAVRAELRRRGLPW